MKLKDYAKKNAEQSVFISNLNREKERLEKELETKKNRIVAMQQEARENELKLQGEISSLQQQLSDGVGTGGGSGDAELSHLREHIKKQSKKIFELQQTLEVTEPHVCTCKHVIYQC